jgi:hypothetical protein
VLRESRAAGLGHLFQRTAARVVHIEVSTALASGCAEVGVLGTVANAGWATPLRYEFSGSRGIRYSYGSLAAVPPLVVVYAATTDPSDPAHVSFACRLLDERYRIDGFLRPGGHFETTATSLPSAGQTGP